MYGYEHWVMGSSGLWMLFAWIVLIVLVVLLIRHVTHDHDPKSEGIALEILEARYARGAIGQEEYLKRRADLGGESGRTWERSP